MKQTGIVDIVIPTYRPDGRFIELLKKIKQQNFPIRHIHVINTQSERFPQEVKNIPGVIVTHITPSEFDHGATRDMAFSLSNASILVFMTQDAIPADRETIGKLIETMYKSKRIAAAYARQIPSKECDTIEKYTRRFNYPKESQIKGKEDINKLGIKTFFCSNVCAAYRREYYEKVGGFPRPTIFNEDMILAGKLVVEGYQIAYVAEAKVIHSHNYTGWQQFQRNFDLAVSQKEYPEVFSLVKAEREGIKLVKETAKLLKENRKLYLIPKLIYQSGCKYLGYCLGKNYEKIPLKLVKVCSMSSRYWGKRENL